MFDRLRAIRLSSATVEWLIATCVLGAVVWLGLTGAWVFRDAAPSETSRPVWSELLSDRLTLGLIRLLVAAAALYALVSIGILVSRRRWVQSISATGIEAESASRTDELIRALERDLREALAERDEAWRLWRRTWGG